MGTDIHGYVEVRKYASQNYWINCMNITSIVGRNYQPFALLFGVRNSWNYIPLAENRGLPTSASDKTRSDYGTLGSEEHSTSWASWEEIKPFYQKYQSKFSTDWALLFTIMQELDEYYRGDGDAASRVRLVVWFDS